MALQCDICFIDFDLDLHRPKILPCGHTICNDCVLNPALGRRCPTCRKDLAADSADVPDNISLVRLIEDNGSPPRKKHRADDTEVQQLQRGVCAGRRVVEMLRQVVPKLVESLNRQLESSVAQLHQLEEALEKQVQRKAAGDEDTAKELAVDQLQLALEMEVSLHLLTTSRCSVVAEEGGSTWKACVQLGGFCDILRLLLLQLRADGHLEKDDNIAVSTPPAAYVGPPMQLALSITKEDLDDGQLKVTDVLRNARRWRNVRILRNLRGSGSDKLLRVLSPQLEEVEISGEGELTIMEEVEKMPSLKRLKVACRKDLKDNFPELPLQLKELWIRFPKENQVRSLERMPRLRSLRLYDYYGPNVTFLPSQYGRLLWLGVGLNIGHKATMLSLIRAHASTLQELQIFSAISNEGDMRLFYFPDLGQDLAASGLHALRRLVLQRSTFSKPCPEADACLMQLRTLRGFLPSSVDVVCEACHGHISSH
ncbi:uncharacterized protein LOC127750343 [Frankliniella occidentalis]|uniref:Uncharacterized protein LOC127750343 n=1 Tax=Frankliniella occidentalis TaxID=133901 RepID=A0A9C6X269_FRAOC|nr:uncharacterized protein LOC127750343 [Frankliniella occidentalis]